MFRQLLVSTLTLLALHCGWAEAEMQERSFTYDAQGVPCEGFVAWDDSLSAPRPGVLVIHQWLGLSDYERQRCRMLAGLGYVAMAGDVYGAGQRPSGAEDAGQFAGLYRSDAALFRARLTAALAALRALPEVDPERVAAIGYCFGGGGVLELARSGAKLAGVISFHGSLSTKLPAEPGSINSRILVCHGADDPAVPPEQVSAFEDEMRACGADWQLISYGGAVHSFTDWGANRPGRAEYNPLADRRSWQAMRAFLEEAFDD